MTDSEIIQSVLSGNTNAFAELVRRHHVKVIGLCQSILSNPTEAEDAAQEAFLKAYKSLKSFRHEAQFSTWMYRLTYRHCLDILRKKKREKAESWENLIEENGETIQGILSRNTPAQLSPEDMDLLNRVLATLSQDYKNVLILREVHGFSYEEIAQSLGASVDAVKARLQRARRALQEKVGHLLSLSGV